MKLSVSLPQKDVEILDRYAASNGLRSRSAALHQAVQMLAAPVLEDEYAAAWAEFASSGEAAAWAAVTADGLDDAQG